LSESVAGVTLVAFGNGAPDIFSAIASYGGSDPSIAKMAVGALLGAGFFVVAVVCGACMMITPFKPPNWPVTRDLVTYLWALYWLIQCMYKGKVELQDSAGFLGYYLCYVLVVVLWECVKYFILGQKLRVGMTDLGPTSVTLIAAPGKTSYQNKMLD